MTAPVVPGYRVGDLLGEGGAARVWAAEGPDGPVALKVLRDADPDAVARLTREAEAARRVDHPGVVRILAAGRTGEGLAWLAMERVVGGDLRGRGPVAPEVAWRWVRAAAEAVAAAHRVGVLHRDLTPANVLVDEAGRVRVTDFGLAAVAGEARLTRTGAALGTPAWLAPERWWGGEADARTDVYGLGAVLYDLLAGRPPWDGDPGELAHRVATAEPPPLPAAPPAVAAFVARALSRDPAARPPDVAAFLHEGDVAFLPAASPRAALARRVPWGLAALPLLGFVGSPDPLVWARLAGPAVLLPVGLGLAALRWPRLAPWAVATGLAGAAMGLRATLGAVADVDPADRFVIFHVGLSESLANGWLGLGLAAVALATRLGPGRADRRVWIGVAVAAVLAVATLDVAAGAFAAAVAWLATRGPGALGAGVAAAGALWARHEAAAAAIWGAGLGRGARAEALAEAADARIGLLAVLVAGIGALALRAERPRWGGALVAGIGVAALAGVVVVERAALAEPIAARLSLWSELDPPQGDGGEVRLGPTLQLGRSAVSLDGRVVMPRAALAGELGRGVLAQALAPVLASGPLVLAADRALPAVEVRAALGVAGELGVQDVDVLYVPGPPPPPGSTSLVLPSDLRARTVRLATLPADGTWGDVAGGLR